MMKILLQAVIRDVDLQSCVSDEVPPQSRMVVVSGLVEPTPPIVSNNISPLPPWKTRGVRSLKIKKNTPF